MTPAPPLIWLGGPVRPLLHGLPERLVESLLDPLGQSRAARWFAEALGTAIRLAGSPRLSGWIARSGHFLRQQSDHSDTAP